MRSESEKEAFGEFTPKENQEKERKPQGIKDAIDFDDPNYGLYKILREIGKIKQYDAVDLISNIEGLRKKQKENQETDLKVITRGEGGENNLRDKVGELLEKEYFGYQIERGIHTAEDLLKKRFENSPEERNNLPYHNSEHTKGVMRRIEMILSVMRKADPSLVSDRDIMLGRLIAAWHDSIQKWQENKVQDGKFEKVTRKRFFRDNEKASAQELVMFMQEVNLRFQKINRNPDKKVFTTNDGFIALEAINATVPGWDPENKTVLQPNLITKSDSIKKGDATIKISLIEIALALSDLGAAGIDGPEQVIHDTKTLFREENLDVLDEISSLGVGNIPSKKKEYFRQRIVGWLKSQSEFIKGRQARLSVEIGVIPESARTSVAELFDKFESSIKVAEEATVECEKMSFEELIQYMGY